MVQTTNGFSGSCASFEEENACPVVRRRLISSQARGPRIPERESISVAKPISTLVPFCRVWLRSFAFRPYIKILLHGVHRDTAFRPQQEVFFSQGDNHWGGHTHLLRGPTDIFENSAILKYANWPEHLAMTVAVGLRGGSSGCWAVKLFIACLQPVVYNRR